MIFVLADMRIWAHVGKKNSFHIPGHRGENVINDLMLNSPPCYFSKYQLRPDPSSSFHGITCFQASRKLNRYISWQNAISNQPTCVLHGY